MKLQENKGFTLIELLLYISIAAVFLLISSVFISEVLASRVKNQTISEVEQQAIQIMQLITQTARNAESITSPTQGNSGTALTLDVLDVSQDPTVFDLSSGVLRITEGATSPASLTSSSVTVSGLSFQNLSRSTTPGTVRIQFTLTYVNPEGRNEYDFSKTFTGSASLRY